VVDGRRRKKKGKKLEAGGQDKEFIVSIGQMTSGLGVSQCEEAAYSGIALVKDRLSLIPNSSPPFKNRHRTRGCGLIGELVKRQTDEPHRGIDRIRSHDGIQFSRVWSNVFHVELALVMIYFSTFTLSFIGFCYECHSLGSTENGGRQRLLPDKRVLTSIYNKLYT
jgi:hypothetical protein